MEGHGTSSTSPFLRPSSATSSSNSFYHESNNIGIHNNKSLELDAADNSPITTSNSNHNADHPGDKLGCDAANDDDEDRLVIAESVTEPVKPSTNTASHNNNNEAASSTAMSTEINSKVDRFLNLGRPLSS